jgi:hypothetical protein
MEIAPERQESDSKVLIGMTYKTVYRAPDRSRCWSHVSISARPAATLISPGIVRIGGEQLGHESRSLDSQHFGETTSVWVMSAVIVVFSYASSTFSS